MSRLAGGYCARMGNLERLVGDRSLVLSPARLVAIILVAALLGGGSTWLLMRRHGTVVVVGGTVTAVNSDLTALGVRFDDRSYSVPGDGEGVAVLGDVVWTAPDGRSYGGSRPSCLTEAHGQRVEFEVLDVVGTRVRYIVGVHCLT